MSEYTVRTGDTLYGIAGKLLGNPLRWPEIYAANRREMDEVWLKVRSYYQRIGSRTVTTPADHLSAGQVLRIPT